MFLSLDPNVLFDGRQRGASRSSWHGKGIEQDIVLVRVAIDNLVQHKDRILRVTTSVHCLEKNDKEKTMIGMRRGG